MFLVERSCQCFDNCSHRVSEFQQARRVQREIERAVDLLRQKETFQVY